MTRQQQPEAPVLENEFWLVSNAVSNMRGFPPETVSETFTALTKIGEHLGLDMSQ